MYKKLLFSLLFSLFLIGCTNEFGNETEQAINETEESVEATQQDQTDNIAESKKEKQTSPNKQSQPSEELTVHYMDVGQGDATLFQFADEEESYTILYDTGDWKGKEVVPYLNKENIEYIDIVIISHPHADHIGQLDKVLHQFEVGEVWMSSNTAESAVYDNAVEAIVQSDADFDEPNAGDVFDIGPLTLTILHPEKLTGKLNEDSISFHAQYGDISFLFTGDTSANEEKIMMQNDLPVEANFLQLGHHGSNTSSDPKFVDAVNPDIAIYSAGKDNKYGHPHEEVLHTFESKDIPLYGTDESGNIIVTTDGKKFDVNFDRKKQTETKTTQTKNACININEATLDEVQEIKHIGASRAEDLLNNRPYESLDDLSKVDGIGPARINDIKEEGKACVEE